MIRLSLTTRSPKVNHIRHANGPDLPKTVFSCRLRDNALVLEVGRVRLSKHFMHLDLPSVTP